MKDFRTVPATDGIQRLPRLGKIALGVRDKTKAGVEFPREVEYFVLADDSDIPPALREKFVKVYGEKPLALDVVFPSEDVPDFFPSAYKLYGTGAGLKCIGDGESGRRIGTLLEKQGAEAGEFFDMDCPGTDCELFVAGECRRVSSLTFMLPRVSVAGYWQIDTSSWHSRVGVLNDLAMARRIFGRIGGLVSTRPPYPTALILVREPREIQHEGKKRTHWTLRVHIRDAERLDLETLQKLRLAAAGTGLMIERHEDAPLDLIPANLHPGADAEGGGSTTKPLDSARGREPAERAPGHQGGDEDSTAKTPGGDGAARTAGPLTCPACGKADVRLAGSIAGRYVCESCGAELVQDPETLRVVVPPPGTWGSTGAAPDDGEPESGPPGLVHHCRGCGVELVSEADGLHCPGCGLIHDDDGAVKPAEYQPAKVRERMKK